MENIQTKHIRNGEEHESPYRSGRFYSVENEWFYSVREKDDQGPFVTKQSAENSLKTYIKDSEHFSVSKKSVNTNNLKMI